MTDQTAQWPQFEAPEYRPPLEEPSGQLVLDLDGFDGPIDLLLQLARDQKVDLAQISILQLADQYLGYVEQIRRIRLELAADYLVMAAWLAYLKSRLLLPPEPEAEEPSGEVLADALAFQLRRLEGFRNASKRLFERPQLGTDVVARGDPETIEIAEQRVFGASLFDLLKAYTAVHIRGTDATYRPAPQRLQSIEQAVERLDRMLGQIPGWATLQHFVGLDSDQATPLERRSAVAATFGATLELAKRGLIDLRQDGAFGPIYLRPREQTETGDDAGNGRDA